MSIFEIIMLISFGTAWPVSIYKSYISRQNQGKSLMFLFIILTGYLSGILHKFYYSYDDVIYLYLINTVMVIMDIMLYFRNSKLENNY